MSEVISIKNFSKSYGSFKAVKNLNLQINGGEVFGFVGKNGAGKSTTIRSIINLIHPTEGTIEVLGMDSVKMSKAINAKVSYVPSESVFYDNVTSMELFKFCLKFTNSDMDRVNELAEYFELDLNKKVSDLSLGNRKKVSLIQAFLKDSEIIILDEPTSGLDPLMQNKFFSLILKEKSKGKTIFLSSHNLSEVEKYCDRVAIIKDGELVDLFNMKDVKINHKQIVSYTTKGGQNFSYDLEEDINALIKKLSKLDLESLEIKSKTVEDEFIEYYKEDAKNE